jgi:hypothetical protein
VEALDHYCNLGHFRVAIDDFRQSLSRTGFENLLWIRIQGFKTYLLGVIAQALLFYLIVQPKAAPNS